MISFRISAVRAFCCIALATGVLGAPFPLAISPAYAQLFPEQRDKAAEGDAQKLLENVKRQIEKGRLQLERNQPVATDTLRAAAQQSLNSLVAFVGPGVLTASPDQLPRVGIWADAVRQSGEAHYWWGRAADQFGMRDEAVTAFARASRFAGRLRPGSSNTLARDSLLALGGTLRDGLPLIAPDDTLETVAEIAHGKLWEPRRFAFQLPSVGIGENTKLDENKREFLITSGRVYPPVPSSTVDVSAALSRVPPIYRNVDADALPEVLRLDRMAVGYIKEVSGPNKGLWRQAVCVFYASTYLTRNNRDDQKRAEAICAQFLKVHALMQNALGLSNPYSRNDVTNLWLSEVSAIWPKDDNDPRVRDAVGIIMPKINTPTTGTKIDNREIDVDPMSFPWNVISDPRQSAPGDVILFQMPQSRDEAEWLRELTHEYGHVVLPAFGGFKAPFEPFANGLIGETLGALWAAQSPDEWKFSQDFGVNWDNSKFTAALSTQVATEAIPSLRVWKTSGPISPLRRDLNEPGLQYLQGMTIYIERVYGADVLSETFAPLISAPAKSEDDSVAPKAVTTEALMTSFPAALNNSLNIKDIQQSGVLPIWLPGALDNVTLPTADFIARANLKLKAGQKISGWLYVPSRLSTLHLEWKAATVSPASLQSDASLKSSVSKVVVGGDLTNNAANFNFKTRPGWQRFNLTARADLEIVAAQFQQ